MGKENKSKTGMTYWHPGYAWACSRKAYETMGGLLDVGILGSGDYMMAMSYIHRGSSAVNNNISASYTNAVKGFQNRVKNLRLGYVPGVIRHYFHGSKINRKYRERNQILLEHKYQPDTMITKNSDGVIIPTDACPQQLLDDIMSYFVERLEDD